MSNIIILDTGDNYILTQKTKNLDLVIELYNMFDISTNIIETQYYVNSDIMQFIYEQIGRIISYGFADTDASTRIDIPAKLITDIDSVIEFYKIKKFWKGVTQDIYQTINNQSLSSSTNINPNSNVEGKSIINNYAPIEDVSKILYPVDNTNGIYIIYNKIYNSSLVYNLPDKYSLKEFPEFEIIEKIDNKYLDLVKQHFHKVSYEKQDDIKTKLAGFKSLYNIYSSSTKTEKDRVKEFLDAHFIISKDPTERMKANNLYKEIINHLCIPYDQSALFKKRVAGYLMEFNLNKKRYTDAYYYYGIKSKEFTNLNSLNLSELEQQRDIERKAWFYTKSEESVK